MNDELTPEPTQPSESPSRPADEAVDALEGVASSTAPLRPAASHPGPATEPPPSGPPTAGGLLRDARLAQGLDLASLAAMLKIPLRRLEALEDGRHDELQGPTFERALAQAACRVLKIDPKPVLSLLPQYERNTLERVSEGINAPFRDGQASRVFELPSLMRPAVIFIVLLIVAAIALFVVPDGWLARVTRPLMGSLAASARAEAPAPAPAAATAPSAQVTAPAAVVPPAASAATAASAAVPAAVRASAPLSPAAVSATAAQDVDEVLAHVAAAPNIPLQVIATADSWVEVVDAQGHSLLSRTVVAGESVGLDGALPMHVKIGNARGTHLKLRGDNVDLTPWTHDNVARLEVK